LSLRVSVRGTVGIVEPVWVVVTALARDVLCGRLAPRFVVCGDGPQVGWRVGRAHEVIKISVVETLVTD
jgi:hypothetical protein